MRYRGRRGLTRRGHQARRSRWYRLLNGDNVLDWLGIAAMQHLLGDAGVDLADLTKPMHHRQTVWTTPTTGRPDRYLRGAHAAGPDRGRVQQAADRPGR